MQGPNLRVLLVSPDPNQLQRFEEALQSHAKTDIALSTCSATSDVLIEATDHGADAVVAALSSPDRMGIASVERLSVLVPETAVIVVVSSEDDELASSLVRAGAQDVVSVAGLAAPDAVSRIQNAVERQRLMVEQMTRRHHLEVANQRFRSLISDRFHSLVMDNADAMLVLDRDGKACFVNPAAERLLQEHSAELITSQLGFPLKTEEECEVQIPRPDGSMQIAAMRVTETVWEGEDAYMVTLRDVTESKRLERAMRAAKQTAEHANRMKSLFLANMSHELRTPLNAIIGFAELMDSEIFGPLGHEKYKEYLNHISQSGSHLLELINDLLDLSKAEAGKLELHQERFDLAKVLRETADVMESRATTGKVALGVDIPRDAMPIKADRLKIRQILLNLLSNAVKFTPPGGEVKISAKLGQDKQIVIMVADTGVGMPPDQIPKAFAAFTQIENAWTKKLAEGSGLGLALTKRLVELHGGTIKLTSDVGVGTTATVKLPAKPMSNDEPEHQDVSATG